MSTENLPEGEGSMAEIVSELLEERARELGDRPALRYKRGGEWRTYTWSV